MRPIGIIVALPAEARSLIRRRPDFDAIVRIPEGPWLTISGVGPERALPAATRLVERGVAALLSWGCAASLDAGPKPGDLILPDRIVGADGTEFGVDGEWRGRLIRALPPDLPFVSGALAESPEVVARVADKRALNLASGALAVDMESAAVARVAERYRLPFLAVRAIADSAAMTLPEAVVLALNPRGEVRLGKLLGHVLRHPSQFAELARLGLAFGAAMDTLRRVGCLAGGAGCFAYPQAADIPE